MKRIWFLSIFFLAYTTSEYGEPILTAVATKTAIVAGKVVVVAAGGALISAAGSYAYRPWAKWWLGGIVDDLSAYRIQTDDVFEKKSSDAQHYAKTLGVLCLQRTREYLVLHQEQVPDTRKKLAKLIACFPFASEDQAEDVRREVVIHLLTTPEKQVGILKSFEVLSQLKKRELKESISDS